MKNSKNKIIIKDPCMFIFFPRGKNKGDRYREYENTIEVCEHNTYIR
jgi:hypothetical protein